MVLTVAGTSRPYDERWMMGI